MIGRRAVVGLSLLSALLFSAFAAQSASAVSASNTTQVTCAEGGGAKDFSGQHCNKTDTVPPGTGKFGHVAIVGSTKIASSNLKITNSTKDAEPATLKSKVGGAKVTIECTAVENDESTTLENTETEKKHNIKGKSSTKFKTCNVKELAKCIVAEPIVASANVEGVEGLEGPKGEENVSGLEFKGSGAEETFATIEFKNKGAEACAVNGKSFPVKGSVIGTCGEGTEEMQNNKECGATVVNTPKFKMQSLKLGVEVAEFSSIVTPFMFEPLGKPISTTKVT
jgi:hypothetical protein